MRRGLEFLCSFAFVLTSCGGGGGGSGGSVGEPIAVVPTPVPPPPPSGSTGCTLRSRQDWAAAQLKEWYLYPETLPASLDPTPYPTVDSYIDALTATARAQGRDRFFTYLTSIAEENAFNSTGSTAGFGFRLASDSSTGRVIVMESFEGTAALAAGIDRGTEIVAIGTTAVDLKSVSSLLASGGGQAVTDALGPTNPGVTRVLRIKDSTGTRDVTVTKTDYELLPVSTRYGAKVIVEGGRKIGYINLRTFILSANNQLRSAFSDFAAQGVTEMIVDLRYNGGGLVSVAELFGDLMGRNRSSNEVFDMMKFRPEKAVNDTTKFFAPQPQSIAPTRIAFIGTGGTASASELMMNAMLPYLHANEALVGTNTYGKPVGQIAIDNAPCDDRFRIIAFAVKNAAGQGDYYSGLASRMEATCQAGDDLSFPLGDPREASTKAALDFLGGRVCTPISAGGGITTQALREGRELLSPNRPNEQQRILPGAF